MWQVWQNKTSATRHKKFDKRRQVCENVTRVKNMTHMTEGYICENFISETKNDKGDILRKYMTSLTKCDPFDKFDQHDKCDKILQVGQNVTSVTKFANCDKMLQLWQNMTTVTIMTCVTNLTSVTSMTKCDTKYKVWHLWQMVTSMTNYDIHGKAWNMC